jgi:hypothetical protein
MSALSPAMAAEPRAIPAVASYADLLQPIPDAVERLRMADAEAAAEHPAVLIEAQYADHHHHHHHRRHRVRRIIRQIVHPHHHHHNHN